MDQSSIYSLSRINTGTDSVSMPDSVMLSITEITYRDLINKITSRVDEDFFYEEFTGTTVIGQTEYTFPVRSSSQPGLKKLDAVSIKYKSTDQYLTPATPTTITNLIHDKNWYSVNQPDAYPIFVVFDKSVSIFPAPKEENSIILYGVSDPKPLTTGFTETDIKIPLDYHHLIVLGNEYRIYKARRMVNEKNDALVEYTNEINRMVSELSDRIVKPLESEQPNTKHLE